jgi:hypothetical protein
MIRIALALGIVPEVVEIFRRAPAWLLFLVVWLLALGVALVVAYFWWIAAGLAAIHLTRLGLRVARARTSHF